MPEPQEQIVTPFAQILHTLHNVHKNYMLLTNATSNRFSSVQYDILIATRSLAVARENALEPLQLLLQY